jgi:hypothetical protein
MYGTGNDTHTAAEVTVRLARDTDAGALLRLAALDSAEPLEGAVLIAESDGHAVAALPLRAGGPIADPFTRTSGVVALLELRAAQLRGAEGAGRGRLRARVRGAARALALAR